MKKPLRVARMTRHGLTVLVVASLSLCPFAHAAGPKSAKPAGQPVTVTPEMIGAGIVSSGAVLPSIPPVTGSRENPVAAWAGPLPYPVVVADRRNNRLIEIAPDKRIVWEFPSPNLKIYRGNDDVFFSPDGRRLMVNEEDNYDIHIVDYQTRSLTWTFGASDTKGSKPGPFQLPGRRAPAGRRQGSDGRHSQLPDSVHRPGDLDGHRPVGQRGHMQARPAAVVCVSERVDAARKRRHPRHRDHRRLDHPASRATARSSGACGRPASAIRPTHSRRATRRSSSPTSRNQAASSSSIRRRGRSRGNTSCVKASRCSTIHPSRLSFRTAT